MKDIDPDSYLVCDYSTSNISFEFEHKGELLKTAAGLIRVGYSVKDLQFDSMSDILDVVLSLKNSTVKDIFFPKCVIKAFKGPKFGVEGVRKISGHPSGQLKCARITKIVDSNYIRKVITDGATNLCESRTLNFSEDRVTSVMDTLDFLKNNGFPASYAFFASTVEEARKYILSGAKEICVNADISDISNIEKFCQDSSLKTPLRVNMVTSDKMNSISLVKIIRMMGADSAFVGTFDEILMDLCYDSITVPYKSMLPICHGNCNSDAMYEYE